MKQYLSLSLDISPLNLVSYLTLRCSLYQCQWIFAYCCLPKVEKKRKKCERVSLGTTKTTTILLAFLFLDGMPQQNYYLTVI